MYSGVICSESVLSWKKNRMLVQKGHNDVMPSMGIKPATLQSPARRSH